MYLGRTCKGESDMLRIVEICPSTRGRGGYVVLQNCGLVSVNLKGWAVCSEAYLQNDPERLAQEIYIFKADEAIQPYTRVVLLHGKGEDGWTDTIDGRKAYCAYWNSPTPIWKPGARIHLLHIQGSQRVPSNEVITVSR
jgi:hypothetical protein